MINHIVLAGQLIGIDGFSQAKDKAICLENEVIREIRDAESYEPPAGVQITDWSDCTVIPGLVDCHDHLGLDLGDEQAQALEHDFVNLLRGVRNARQLLAAGITTLRSVGEKKHMDVHWRDAIAAGWIAGPRLVVCGQFIMRTGGHAWYLGHEADGPDEVRKAVREQIKNGAEFIKLMITGGSSTAGSVPTISDYTDQEIQAAIDEAHRFGRPVAAHIHGGPGARASIEAGVDSIEHGVFLTDEDLGLMAEKKTVLCATYSVYSAAAEQESVPEFMKENCRRAAAQYLDVLSKVRKLGIQVVLGGDTHHADPLSNVQGLIQAGFPPVEALQAATLNGAKLVGLEDRIGSIESGKYADLVALADDPLKRAEALNEVVAVMKGGKVYLPECLQTL